MSFPISLHAVWARRHWYSKCWRRPGPPWFINIEPTNLCNLRCTICSHDGSRPTGFMSLSLCRSLAHQARELGVVEARFFLAGEPLLHPRLPQLVRIAKEAGLRTSIHTNATLLNERNVLALMGSGLHFMSISFDGEDETTYEAVQKGARFRDTVEKTRRFLEIRDRYGRGPETVIQIIKPYREREPLAVGCAFKGLFRSHPPDHYLVLHPHTWSGEMEQLPVPPRARFYHPCLPLWEGISVYWDGRVTLCCGDLNAGRVIGDATIEPLRGLWYGSRLTETRKLLAQGPPPAGHRCSGCDATWHRSHPMLRDLLSFARDHLV